MSINPNFISKNLEIFSKKSDLSHFFNNHIICIEEGFSACATNSNWFKMEIYLLDNVSVSPFSWHISSVQTNDNDNKHLVVFDISCGISKVKKHDNWIFLNIIV